MRLKHRERPYEIIPQFDGQVSVILSEGFCVASTQNEFESFLYQKTMWRKISVSSMYVDEFEIMSYSESATLDLKITVVNADEGLKSIVFNFDRRGRCTYELTHTKMMFNMKMMINSHHICCTDIDRCDIFRANANKICEEIIMYVYEKK